MVITKARAVMDYVGLIERAIERELRGDFVTFLGTYSHVEFGRARPLTLDETSLVLTCMTWEWPRLAVSATV
jgi:hypothetical protein